MKTLRKVFGMLFAVMMLVSVTTVNATNITITGGADSSQYSAYKLLDATVSDDGKNYSYSVNDKYKDILKSVINSYGKEGYTGDSIDVVEFISKLSTDTNPTIQKFADAVYSAIQDANPAIDADKTAAASIADGNTNPTAIFENVDKGYYLIVETETGETGETESDDSYSLVMLNTAGNEDINVETKENVPTLEKKVKEKNDSTGTTTDWQDGADYDVNDPVEFRLKGTVSANIADYSTYAYTFHDVMSEGLTFNSDSVVVKYDLKGNKEESDFVTLEKTNYEVSSTASESADPKCTFEVKFTDLKKAIEGINKDTVIYVYYNATLNSNSVIGSAGNPNQARLEYANNPYGNGTGYTPWDKVIVFTYELVAKKVDESRNPLEGAGFTLYKYSSEGDNYVAVGNEIKNVTTFEFSRVDAGKYKLVETTVPAGYSKAEDLEFTVEATYDTNEDDPKFIDFVIKDAAGDTIISTKDSSNNDTTYKFTLTTSDGTENGIATGVATTSIENKSGSKLPSTGGIGTTIFYVVGGVLAVGAAVLLVAKKRMD